MASILFSCFFLTEIKWGGFINVKKIIQFVYMYMLREENAMITYLYKKSLKIPKVALNSITLTQKGNQKPQIEGQTTQLPKRKRAKGKVMFCKTLHRKHESHSKLGG